MGTIFPAVSALAAVVGLYFGWRTLREAALRRGDVLVWANDVIHELRTVVLVCTLREPELDQVIAKEKLTQVIFNSSILIERGRLFFNNVNVGDYDQQRESAYPGRRLKIFAKVIFHISLLIERWRLFFNNTVVAGQDQEKWPAYRGYRPLILDPIVVIHDIALEWSKASEDKRLRMGLIAEDQAKKFVSIIQEEIGRNRTRSAGTRVESAVARVGGQGLRLRHLLDRVDKDRLERLRPPM